MFGRAGCVVLWRTGSALWYDGDVMRYFEYRTGGGSCVCGRDSVFYAVAAGQITYLFAQQLFQLVIGFGPRAVHGVESAEGIGA